MVPFMFLQNSRYGKEKLSLILHSEIPFFQETVYLFERWYDMFYDLSIHCQFKGLHVNIEPAVRVLQQVVQIEQAEERKKKDMRRCFRYY